MNSSFRLSLSVSLLAFFTLFQSSCEKAVPLIIVERPPGETLSLNDGKKWQIDDHTRTSLARMNALVEKSAPDELGRAMAGEISNLFKGCTMQGPAHDQLHLFLTDLLGNVNGLYSSTTPDERSVEIRAIRESLKRFDSFFE